MSGFVSFVSSGPGDPELLTLKAVDRMQRANVILFDDLASGPVLSHASPKADLIAVGKRAGKTSSKQGLVNQVILDHAEVGARVVRLKSGDCGLFGRLEEELVAVRDAGIECEIIPGVSSASAAAAAAAIPLTRRMTARRVQYITGADITGDLPEDLNWDAVADPAATTVVFMGKRTFADLANRLVDHGLPETTPALLAEAVGHPTQSLHRTTIKDLASKLSIERSNLPAVILYGPLAVTD